MLFLLNSVPLKAVHVGTPFASYGAAWASQEACAMTARVTIAGHPIHPMLVAIPIGLWIFTLTSDVVFTVTADPRWAATAFFTLAGGIAGALLAAVPGLFDLLGLQASRERRLGIFHMSVNLAIVAVQAVNFALRATSGLDTNLTFALSALAVAALLISGWLGGQLVHVLGVTQPDHVEGLSPQGDRLHSHT